MGKTLDRWNDKQNAMVNKGYTCCTNKCVEKKERNRGKI